MKILLIGEYSRLHNSLKAGLLELGHEVTLVGTGDMFKNYPVDISIKPIIFSDKKFPHLIRKIIYRLSKKDIAQWEIGFRFKKILPQLKNYDVVQLINSHSIGTFPKSETALINKIFQQNKSAFLLACGDDYPVIKHYLDGNERYHILTPFFENNDEKSAEFSLKYMTKPFKDLFNEVYENVKAVIPCDVDYKLPWLKWDKTSTLIPTPILLPKEYIPISLANEKINIFFGINTLNYTKKGYKYFEEALVKINQKYPERVSIKITKDLPFNEYIQHFNQCHILLDNIYGYDQGYNALEAMARGKVVFTGAEKEFEDHYNLKDKRVAINALPDAIAIEKELEHLILNPNEIIEIGYNARTFVEKEHDYLKIAKKYIALWNSY